MNKDTEEIKIIKKDSHGYGQSEFTLSRPLTMQDAMPKLILDPNKSYRLVNGVITEMPE
jgi:hypothetical protein